MVNSISFFNSSGSSPTLQRKPPAKRLFNGLVGRAVVEPPPRFINSLLRDSIPFDPSVLQDGRTASCAMFTMTPAAIRAAKWREKQKKDNPDFKQSEAKRKANERGEVQRQSDIEEIVKSNPTPVFVMTDAPHGKGLLVTGGYDGEKVGQVVAKQNEDGRRCKPSGHGADENGRPLKGSHLFGEFPSDEATEFDDTFVEKQFKRTISPKEVRILRGFVFQHTRKKSTDGAFFCLGCDKPVATFQSDLNELAFQHFMEAHVNDLWPILRDRLASRGCPEDHEGWVQRHGGGDIAVRCKRCRKLLYKPPRRRSDKP